MQRPRKPLPPWWGREGRSRVQPRLTRSASPGLAAAWLHGAANTVCPAAQMETRQWPSSSMGVKTSRPDRGTSNANHGDWNRGREEPQAKQNISSISGTEPYRPRIFVVAVVLALFLLLVSFYFKTSLGGKLALKLEPSAFLYVQFSSVKSLSRVRLFATPWTAAGQASLSITNSRSLPKPIFVCILVQM